MLKVTSPPTFVLVVDPEVASDLTPAPLSHGHGAVLPTQGSTGVTPMCAFRGRHTGLSPAADLEVVL